MRTAVPSTSGLRRVTRAVAAWAPVLKVVPRPHKPLGVSAIVRVKDEETWLEPCIRSIAATVDEIIAGDNGSTDGSLDILRRLEHELGGKLRVIECGDVGIKGLTNHLLQRTRFRWVIRWDADFVARTEGPQSIQILRDWLEALDDRRYYMIYLRMVELAGDLGHQRPETSTRADCHCFTSTDTLQYVYNPSGYEAPKVPLSYGAYRFELPTFFHVDVKPDRRMFLSHVWKEYLLAVDRSGQSSTSTFETFVDHILETRWRGMAVDDAASEWAVEHFRNLVPYDEKLYGAYPSLLQPHLEEPHFRIRYSAGEIVGRDTNNDNRKSAN